MLEWTEIQCPCEQADTQLGVIRQITASSRARPAAGAAPVEQNPKPLEFNMLSNTRTHYAMALSTGYYNGAWGLPGTQIETP